MTKRIDCIKSSGIRKIMDKAAGLNNLINLSIGQPDFNVPNKIKDYLKQSIDNNYTGYSPSAGIKELREKIIEKHNTEDAILTSGVTAAIFLAYSSILEEGDELIIPDPYFVVYPDLCKFLGARPVIVKTKEDFTLDIKNIKNSITPKTKAIIINQPNNPTGKIYSYEELKQLAHVAKENKLWVISDEVYSEFDYENNFRSFKEFFEKAIILNGFSKSFAMTGFRIGYATGPKEVIKDMIKLQQYTFVCASSISQWAVNECFHYRFEHLEEFRKRRDFIYRELKPHFVTISPEGAFYFFLKLPEDITGEHFTKRCLKKNLLVVPGESFTSSKNFVRLSYATSIKNLEKAVEILKETIEELKDGA